MGYTDPPRGSKNTPSLGQPIPPSGLSLPFLLPGLCSPGPLFLSSAMEARGVDPWALFRAVGGAGYWHWVWLSAVPRRSLRQAWTVPGGLSELPDCREWRKRQRRLWGFDPKLLIVFWKVRSWPRPIWAPPTLNPPTSSPAHSLLCPLSAHPHPWPLSSVRAPLPTESLYPRCSCT